MEYGLIKDTTLQAIADGLREKGIVSATTEKLVDYLSFKSNNVTSSEDPTPISVGIDHIDVTIPEATSLEFVFHIGIATPEDAGNYRCGILKIKKGNQEIFSTSINKDTEKILLTRIDPAYGNSVAVELANGGYANYWSGVIFEVYPLDKDGNRLQIYRDLGDLNTLSPKEMAEAITNFDMPIGPTEEAFILTGSLNYKFYFDTWSWFIKQYGDKVTTRDITSLQSTFHYSDTLTEIPFVLNVKNITSLSYTFAQCTALEVCPKVRGTLIENGNAYNADFSNVVTQCFKLRDLEDLFEEDFLIDFDKFKITSAYSCPKPTNFSNCYSLRRIPSWWYKFRINPESTVAPAASYSNVYNLVSNCYVLDEIRDIPVYKCAGPQTSNMFSSTFGNTQRLKAATFETNDGQPIVANWKSQVIDFTTPVGYVSTKVYITDYNSGITADKEVKDDATYQALKNDPDLFATNIAYSRYNHDSAVETINSLPDTSAYLASAGGTNTIKFKKTSGSKTDGGAIENLTAEEIAVAAAKGWTVTFV